MNFDLAIIQAHISDLIGLTAVILAFLNWRWPRAPQIAMSDQATPSQRVDARGIRRPPLLTIILLVVGVLFIFIANSLMTKLQISGPMGPSGPAGAAGPMGPPGPSAHDTRLDSVPDRLIALEHNAAILRRLALLEVCLQRIQSELPTPEGMTDILERARNQIMAPANPFPGPVHTTIPINIWGSKVSVVTNISTTCYPKDKIDILDEPSPVQMDEKVNGEPTSSDVDMIRRFRRFFYQSNRSLSFMGQLKSKLTQEILSISEVLSKENNH